MMPNDNIFFLDSSLFTLGHFVISLNPARFKNPEPYPGKPRITDILANIGSQPPLTTFINFSLLQNHWNRPVYKRMQIPDKVG